MTRQLLRIVFIITLLALAMAVGIELGRRVMNGWGGGTGAVFGMTAGLFGGRLFDRFWPRDRHIA